MRGRFDPVDGGRVALRRETRARFAVEARDRHVRVVDGVGEVRGRSTGLAAADRSVVDDDHLPAFARERVRDGEARDTGADDRHVGADVARERGARRQPDGCEPG